MKKAIYALPTLLLVCLFAPLVSAQTEPGAEGSEEARKLNAQAVAMFKEGKYEEVIKLEKQALALWEKELGNEHKLIATGSTNLAEMYRALQNYKDAAAAYQRALKIQEKLVGPEHPDLAIILLRLGWMRHALSQPDEAESLFKRLVSVREKKGAEDEDLVESLLNLTNFYRKIGRPSKSFPVYQRLIAMQEKRFGPESEAFADILLGYSSALEQEDQNPAEASEIVERAFRILRKVHPDRMIAGSITDGGVLWGTAIHKVQPEYPAVAKAEGVSGKVNIEVEIDETGKVIKAVILSGADWLAVPSREAALKWRFNPATLNGKPVKVMGVLTFKFELQ